MPRFLERLTSLASRLTISSPRSSPERSMFDVLTTPRVVNVLKEVNTLEPYENKKRLLHHQFRAQAKELIGLPFHSYAMELRADSLEPLDLQLYDHIYKNPNVLERCQLAIDIAKDAIESARFTKEKNQIHTLLNILTKEVSGWEQPLLSSLATKPSTKHLTPQDRQLITDALSNIGWRRAPHLLSPEVAWQFNIKPQTDCWVGPKFLYIMPHSSVHRDKTAMYVIAQSAYLPETNRWLVLQDQHMTTGDWDDYDSILGQSSEANETESGRETRIMADCMPLDTDYQTKTATDTFLDIIYLQRHKTSQAKQLLATQQRLLQKYDHLEKTFDLHAHYLLEILDLENEWEPNWTDAKRERLFQAYLNTFSTFYHQKSVKPEQIQGWLKAHADQYRDPNKRNNPHQHRDEHRKLASVFSPWVLLKIESQLECNLLAIPSLMMKQVMSPNILQALQMKTLSFKQLESVIGTERAQRWKLGTCIACGESNVWIGDKTSGKECDVCLLCEMKDNAGIPIGPGAHNHNVEPSIHPGWQQMRKKAGINHDQPNQSLLSQDTWSPEDLLLSSIGVQ